MVSAPTTLATAESSVTPPGGPVERKRQRWFELCLVLLIAVGGNLYNSLYILNDGLTAEMRVTNTRWLLGTGHEVASLLLLGYVLWNSGRRPSDIGLRWSFRDLGVGTLIAVASYVAYATANTFIYFLYVRLSGNPPTAHAPRAIFGGFSIFAVPYSLVNPLFEELIVRAYLMTEIRYLTGSAALAVFVSVAVQFSYHLYYGWWIALSIAFQLLVLALYYARWRRALPLIVAHEIFDLYGLVRL